NFGNFQLASATGQVFVDSDGDGLRQPTEVGAGGWVLDLFQDGGATPVDSTTSAPSGNFSFSNLGPHTYRVREIPQGGWLQTSTDPADVPARSGVNVGSGLDFGTFQQISLSGRAFTDTNGNGAADAGEPNAPGWVIDLLRTADGSTTASA